MTTATAEKYKVLYVDDEKGNCNIFYSVYRRKFDVTIAESGQEALQILSEKGPFHLLITDQKMPGMTGTELLTASLEIDPTLVKIIITGYADLEAMKEAVNRTHLFQYVNKPLQYDDFFMVLDRACEYWQLREDNTNLLGELKKANRDLEQKVRERTEELRSERAILDAHFNSADDLFFLMDKTTKIIALNSKSRKEVVNITTQKAETGDTLINLVPEILRPSFMEAVEKAFGGTLSELEFRNKTEDQTRYFRLKFMPAGLPDGSVFGVSMNASEITKMKHAELKIKELVKTTMAANTDLQEKNHEIEIGREELRANNDLLKEQQEQLSAQHRKMQQSIRYAGQIQKAVLGSHVELQSCFPGSFVINKPRDLVSGDFCFFENAGDIKYIILSDCTGHGVPGALLTMMGHTFLSEIIIENKVQQIEKIFIDLDEKFHKALKAESDAYTTDGMDIGILAINTANESCEYAGAHISCYTAEDGELLEYSGEKFSIGMKSALIRPVKHEFAYNEKSVFYLSSDGFRDQHGPEGKMGRRKFKQVLLETSGRPIAEQADYLENFLSEHSQDFPQTDDILVLGISLNSVNCSMNV